MSRVLRLQILVSLIGAVLIGGAIGLLAYTSGVSSAPAVGGAYVEGVVGQPKVLNPLLASPTDYPAQTIDALVFSGLVQDDSSGTPQPDLATSWSISSDGLTYTFKLRPNVLWQDGKPFTADDVIYTVDAIQAPDFPGNPDLAAAWQGVKATKIDDLTVAFSRTEPFAPFLDYATVGILPAHLLKQTSAKDLPSSTFNLHPIGTGPYTLKTNDPRSALLEVSDRYYNPKPFISRIMLRYYPDDAAVARALLARQVSGDWRVTAATLPELQRDGNLRFYRAVEPSFSGLCFNLDDPLMGLLEVRQAIALTIDREALIQDQLHGLAQVDDSPIPSTSWAFDSSIKRYAPDPAAAASTLSAAGWSKGSDGVWAKNGEQIAPVLLSDNRPDHVALASAIAQQLRAGGINATVQTVGFDGLVADFLAPRHFQMALLDWAVPGGDPDPYSLWASSQATATGLNFSNWKSTAADQALETGRNSVDLTVRKQAYQQFQSVFAADLPAFLLFHPVYEYAIDSAIQGVTLPDAVHPWDRFDSIAHWYMRTQPSSPIFN